LEVFNGLGLEGDESGDEQAEKIVVALVLLNLIVVWLRHLRQWRGH
jgi:hypothetical protein